MCSIVSVPLKLKIPRALWFLFGLGDCLFRPSELGGPYSVKAFNRKSIKAASDVERRNMMRANAPPISPNVQTDLALSSNSHPFFFAMVPRTYGAARMYINS